LTKEALSKQGDKVKCTTDPVTFEMSCEAKGKCEGGEPTVQVDTVATRNVAYPCGTKCNGLLLVKCCGTCADNQMKANSGLPPFHEIPTTVQCPGCDKAALDDIVKVNTNKCSVDADGKFRCSVSESCQLGEPQVSTKTTERKCNLTPCDVCADADLKAQCCSACLTDVACKGEADPMSRAVCRGCDTGMAFFALPYFFLLSCLLSEHIRACHASVGSTLPKLAETRHTSAASALSTGAIAGIVVACVALFSGGVGFLSSVQSVLIPRMAER
jgi:hypothetical protein